MRSAFKKKKIITGITNNSTILAISGNYLTSDRIGAETFGQFFSPRGRRYRESFVGKFN